MIFTHDVRNSPSWATGYRLSIEGLGVLSLTLESDSFTLSALTPCCGEDMGLLPHAEASGPYTGPFSAMQPGRDRFRLRCSCDYYAPYFPAFTFDRMDGWDSRASDLTAWLDTWACELLRLNPLTASLIVSEIPTAVKLMAFPLEMWPAHDSAEARGHAERVTRALAEETPPA